MLAETEEGQQLQADTEGAQGLRAEMGSSATPGLGWRKLVSSKLA